MIFYLEIEMPTAQNFTALLRDYMPYDLLMEEMKKRNYFWGKVKKKTGWKRGATLQVPFEGAEYSSLSFGALVDSSDIANMIPVLGSISTQPELWGAIKFAESDLDSTESLEQAFAQLVPGKIKQFISRMEQRVSLNLLNGFVCRVLDTYKGANGDTPASGIIYVDQPQYLTIGERVNFIDDDTTALTTACYVRAIDLNTHLVTFFDARTAGAAVNLSTFTEAQNAKIHTVGGTASNFTSLRTQLLSSVNGGSATQFGQTKTAYPILQGQNFSGASATASNLLDVLNEHFFDTAAIGKGNATEMIMSYKNFRHCINSLQDNKRYAGGDKTAGHGFKSIDLLGPDNDFKLTGIRDMADDAVMFLDWNTLCFHGDSMFERKRHMNGDEYFLERSTTGYSYIVDTKINGDLVCSTPSYNGIVHGISIA